MELPITLFTAIANFLLGLFVYSRNPKSHTNQLLGFLAIQLSLWAAANYFSLNSPTVTQTLFWIRMVMFITSPMGVTIFLLLYTFPDTKIPLSRNLTHFLWIITGISSILAITPFMFSDVTIVNRTITPRMGPALIIYAIILLVPLVAAFISIGKKYYQSNGIRKIQIKFLILGSIFAFGLSAITNFIFVILLHQSSFVIFGPLFSLVLVSTLSYAIVKHGFLDINFLVARAVSFTLLTALLAVIYGLTLFRLPIILPQQYQIPAFIIIAIVLAYTFGPLRRTIEHVSDNIFHREPYSSEKLLESLGNILRSTIDIDRLTKLVLNTLADTLHLEYAAFALVNESGKPDVFLSGHAPKISITDNMLHNLISSSDYKLMLFDELNESPVKMLMRTMQIGAVLPLTVKSTHYGIVILGQKTSGDTFNNQDIDVFNILLPQLAIAIQNAKSYDEISKFNVTLKQEVDRQTKDLKTANEHLKHLDQLKDEFVFIATHELKNPVTAMRGYLSLLNEGTFGKIPEKMHDPIQQLTASNQQLVELVNDLLQIARSEAKTVKLQVEPVELKKLIESVVEGMKSLATEKELAITHEAPLPMVVNADPQRLREVIQNLVSNAIKYSDKGSIKLTHEIQPDCIITNVSDTGVGISKADQEKLFTRFFRADSVVTEGIPGTGLGLFIVKQLVEKMGGKIWVNSELNVGTTFSFSLPRL